MSKDTKSPRWHALGLDKTGNLYGWGSNAYKLIQKSDIYYYDFPTPILIPTPEPFVKVASGCHHCLGLTKNGNLFAWGWNYYGQISSNISIDPEPYLMTQGVVDMAGGLAYTLVL